MGLMRFSFALALPRRGFFMRDQLAVRLAFIADPSPYGLEAHGYSLLLLRDPLPKRQDYSCVGRARNAFRFLKTRR